MKIKGFRPSAKIIGSIYAIGIPSIIMQSIGSVMTYCMNRILIGFSSTATAVFGVYFKLQSFFFMPLFGLNNGITPIIAYNYGAQKKHRMIKTIKMSLVVSFCLMFIGFLGFELIPDKLLGLFEASTAMLYNWSSGTSYYWNPLFDCLVLHYCRYGIPVFGKGCLQHGGFGYASACRTDSGCISSGSFWRLACHLVVIPDCGEYVTCGINDISYEDLQKNHQTAAG